MTNVIVKHLLVFAVMLMFGLATNIPAHAAELANASASPRPPLRFILDMVHDNPGEEPFDTKFNDPAVLKTWGYNGQVIKTFPQTALTYESFDPGIVPSGSPERAWVVMQGKLVDGRIAAAKAVGMPVYCFTDMLVIPEKMLLKYLDEIPIGEGALTKEMIDEKRNSAIHGSLSGTKRRISILKPMTQKIVRAQINELFGRFPDINGIFVRFGETYLHDTPFHVGGSPVGGGPDEHQALIKLLREEVCEKRNKLVFYRTWGWDGFLVKPTIYNKITDGIEPHSNLIFSIKHSNGDFTRDVPFNKTLGIGNHAQLVEVSCNQAGLYGKNAWPYYIGAGIIDGWDTDGPNKVGIQSLVDNKNFVGVWTWTRGDGWKGPYTPNEFWVDLNAYVIMRYGQQPGRSEKAIFEEYCREKLNLDEVQTAKLRELCLLATNATYYGQESALFKSSSWWCRDEYLSAQDFTKLVESGLGEKLLEEKSKAVADWKRVEQLSREVKMPKVVHQEFVEVSSTYGRIKMALTEQIWTMQILFVESKASGNLDKIKMEQAIRSYDTLWDEWSKLKKNHACCPTLYRDDLAVYCGPPFRPFLERYRKMIRQ